MRSHSSRTTPLQLESDKTYPCPTCRSGELIPITLTEAWGCTNCQEIFEKRAPDTLVKLSTQSWRQSLWQWDGQTWERKRIQVSRRQRWQNSWFIGIVIWAGILLVEWLGIPAVIGGLALLLLVLVMVFRARSRH